MKHCDTQFFNYLYILNKERIYIDYFLISNKKIDNKNISESLELQSLDPVESQYLFVYYCNRNLEKKEIDIDAAFENEKVNNTCELVNCSSRLKACKGLPKYIKKLAELTSTKSLNKIDVTEYLPKRLKNDSLSSYNSNNSSLTRLNTNQNNHNSISNQSKNVMFLQEHGGNPIKIQRLNSSVNERPFEKNGNFLNSSAIFSTGNYDSTPKLEYQYNNLNKSTIFAHSKTIRNNNSAIKPTKENILESSKQSITNNQLLSKLNSGRTSGNSSISNTMEDNNSNKKDDAKSRKSFLSSISASSIGSTNIINNKFVKRRERNKSEIKEEGLSEEEEQELNNVISNYSEEGNESDDEDDQEDSEPFINNQIRELESSKLSNNSSIKKSNFHHDFGNININNINHDNMSESIILRNSYQDYKNDDDNVMTLNRPIVIQNIFNSNMPGENSLSMNININNSGRFSKKEDINPFRKSNDRKKYTSKIIFLILFLDSFSIFHQDSDLTTKDSEPGENGNLSATTLRKSIIVEDSERKNSKKSKAKSGKMYKKYHKKKNNKYFLSQKK